MPRGWRWKLSAIWSRLMMALFTAPELPVTFVQNPKAGCTSVKEAMWKSIDRRGGVPTFVGRPPPGPGPWMPDPRPAAMEKETFAVVRHPLARLYSAYWNKIRMPAGREAFASVEKLRHWRDLNIATDPGLGGFLDLISTSPPDQLDMHWRPQHLNLTDRIDNLFKLERPEVLAAYLNDKLGEQLGQSRSSTYSIPIQEAFTPTILAKAVALYAEDFLRFGYLPETFG
jgi:hypothetical protein